MGHKNYKTIKSPLDYPGHKDRGKYIYEHHYVWWQHTGELLQKGEIIHHKNANYKDNDIANLEKLTNIEHIRHHCDTRTTPFVWVKCGFCYKLFLRPYRSIRYRQTYKQRHFYCSHKCQGKKIKKDHARNMSSILIQTVV